MNTVTKNISSAYPAKSSNSSLGKIGSLEVKIADTSEEIAKAIELRQIVFSNATAFNHDNFDQFCRHLIVIDNELANHGAAGNVVATYRLLDSAGAEKAGGFCAEKEFNIDALLEGDLNLLEFGRSCVHPNFRNKRTIELLWAGSWAYVVQNSIHVMFGCASFEGVDPNQHSCALSFLHHFASAVEKYPITSLNTSETSYELVRKEAMELKTAMKNMPTIIKGYLRLGAMFSNAIAIDREFNTTDILVIMPVDRLNPRYVKYYGEDAMRHSR